MKIDRPPGTEWNGTKESGKGNWTNQADLLCSRGSTFPLVQKKNLWIQADEINRVDTYANYTHTHHKTPNYIAVTAKQ